MLSRRDPLNSDLILIVKGELSRRSLKLRGSELKLILSRDKGLYMVKKTLTSPLISTKNGHSDEAEDLPDSDELQEFNSAVETLLHKIDRIEQSQGQLVSSTSRITEAIYDPSEGIFAKLASQKLESFQQFSQLDTKLAEVSAWKQFHDAASSESEEKREKTASKVAELETSIAAIKKSREMVWAVTKWVLVAIGGGAVTLAFKYVGQALFNLH
jgi:cation transport regulator ChaB